MVASASTARAQTTPDTVARGFWSVDGQVRLGLRSGPKPVAGAWVVVHRIATDEAGKVGGGPLDSGRTNTSGSFRIRYPHYGASSATYIAVTTYSGVSYITAPLTRARVSGDDATIMVFDTAAPPYPIRVAGRHFVITAPDSGDRRRVIEVYELLNDSTLTAMGSEARPVWRAALPPGVKDLQLNPVGDITPGTAKQEAGWLKVFAPISPGLRQLSFTYTLPADVFPLSLPVVDSTAVLEVLVQELAAMVDGAGLTEVAPVVQDGRTFRRLLAQDVAAKSVLRVTMPMPASLFEKKGVPIIVSILAVVLAIVLGVIFWRRRRPRAPVASARTVSAVDALVRELAVMDADFERRASPSDLERAAWAAKRITLKSRLTAALAARPDPT